MSSGKRYSTDEPLTEHDIAARLDRAVERVWRIMLDARQIGLAQQIMHSRFLTYPTLGILRAELDAWGVEPAPFDVQLAPLTPDAQAVADAYARWLSNYPKTGAPMSEQSTEQQPDQTVSTTVETDGAKVSVDDSTAGADAAADGEKSDDTASESAPADESDSAKDGGSGE